MVPGGASRLELLRGGIGRIIRGGKVWRGSGVEEKGRGKAGAPITLHSNEPRPPDIIPSRTAKQTNQVVALLITVTRVVSNGRSR